MPRGGGGREQRPGNGLSDLGNVRWDHYQHWQLFNMVMDGRPNEVFERHREWTKLGNSIVKINEEVQRDLDTLLGYWRGGASATAASSSTRLLDWSQEAAETTQRIGEQLGDYGNALVRARNSMPQPQFIHSEAAHRRDEEVGIVPGAAGDVQLLQLNSDYLATAENRKRAHQEAIQVMQTFEQDAVPVERQVDNATYPDPLPVQRDVQEPGPIPGGDDDSGRPTPPPWPPPSDPGDTSDGMPAPTPGQNAGASGLGQGGGSPGGGHGGAGGYGGLAAGVGSGAGADSVHGGRNFAGGPLGVGAGAGAAGGAGGTSAFGRGPGGMLAGQAAAEAAAARGAGGAGGVAGARGAGTGFFPPMAGARGDDDQEKRVAPYIVPDDDLFDDDRPVAPPVFGA